MFFEYWNDVRHLVKQYFCYDAIRVEFLFDHGHFSDLEQLLGTDQLEQGRVQT